MKLVRLALNIEKNRYQMGSIEVKAQGLNHHWPEDEGGKRASQLRNFWSPRSYMGNKMARKSMNKA